MNWRKAQRIITVNNVKGILLEKGLIEDGEPVFFKEISEGVSSIIIMISKEDGNVVLKQALPKLRLKEDVVISLPLKRNLYEKNFLDLMNATFPSGIFPSVKFYDADNFYFIMTSAPQGSVQWKKLLLDGQIDLSIGEKFGYILAEIHNNTANNKEIKEKFMDNSVYVLGRINPCYRVIQKVIPEIRYGINKIISRSLSTRIALCTVDFTPKNVLVKEKNFMLIDHEGANYGDPSFDIGLLLAHIFLKAVHNKKLCDNYFALIKAIWDSYCNRINVWEGEYLEKMVTQHVACMMLSRVIGKLPVEYLTEEEKNLVQVI
ncbi:MAG: phosphotransferase, partial [Actinobacteria bacterium]|nr:phosphotransferase [Actinomycetota bacterium]